MTTALKKRYGHAASGLTLAQRRCLTTLAVHPSGPYGRGGVRLPTVRALVELGYATEEGRMTTWTTQPSFGRNRRTHEYYDWLARITPAGLAALGQAPQGS